MDRRRPHLPPPPRWEDEPLPDESDGGWLIIYLDVMTLMLCLFVVLLAYSSYSADEYEALARALSSTPNTNQAVTQTAAPEAPQPEADVPGDPAVDTATQQLQEQYRDALLDQGLQEAVDVQVSATQVNLQINERILFELGQAELTEAGRAVLEKLIPLLMVASDHSLSIEGHTDPTPIANAQFPSNWELSSQRATGVLRFLLTQGIPAERMRAVGYADTRPLADNSTPEGRARNRRVSLILQRPEE
ncbi:OmpA/MotB family protein [Sedimenticola thiotaurini]|uniref:OmpA-like domain-containing protein n=1 Tax=Sedimenticola thiotaurini TaxID=1543721 RepID=A0A0F7JZY7_9GAMM|nr:OmpA family protein [Sedimenticola thiotaurini]AKH21212.1 hypothetical protein AAY24_13520 [Sedimenticola thiotaurini]